MERQPCGPCEALTRAQDAAAALQPYTYNATGEDGTMYTVTIDPSKGLEPLALIDLSLACNEDGGFGVESSSYCANFGFNPSVNRDPRFCADLEGGCSMQQPGLSSRGCEAVDAASVKAS